MGYRDLTDAADDGTLHGPSSGHWIRLSVGYVAESKVNQKEDHTKKTDKSVHVISKIVISKIVISKVFHSFIVIQKILKSVNESTNIDQTSHINNQFEKAIEFESGCKEADHQTLIKCTIKIFCFQIRFFGRSAGECRKNGWDEECEYFQATRSQR